MSIRHPYKISKRGKMAKVVIAMSGGLDSSVAAALLKRADFALPQGQGNLERSRRVDVIGVFIKFWSAPHQNFGGGSNRCCSLEAEVRARKVAEILKIPFYVFNFEKEFKKKIVDYFLREYKKGRTPNPCVVCNKEIKFGLLLKKALVLDADYIATGHYARKRETKNYKLKTINYKLLRAKDKNKDQSYFLWMLNQGQLRRILFPIGDYTRKEVENLARKFKLPVLKARKSVEICFIQTTINDFLARHLKQKPGQIIYSTPEVGYRVIGQHQGLAFYTIGQRKGIGLSGGPWYVMDKDLKKNLLIVTKNEKDLLKKELICKNVNWILGKEPRLLGEARPFRAAKLPLKIKAKIRYRHQLASATIYKLSTTCYKLTFDRPQRAITPGQSAVFYRGEELLGGGIII